MLDPDTNKTKTVTNIKPRDGNSNQVGGKNNTGPNKFKLLSNPLIIFFLLLMISKFLYEIHPLTYLPTRGSSPSTLFI